MKKFNLSEKIYGKYPDETIDLEDVKEFIKRLKDFFCECTTDALLRWEKCDSCNTINTLAGAELCSEKEVQE